MSAPKQILLCLLLLAAAAGGWFVYQDPSLVGLAGEPSGAQPGERAAGERRPGAGARVPGQPGAGGAINVITEAVAMQEGGDRVTAIGTAKAIRSATLLPQVAGMIAEINFTPGDTVREGDVLVQLDNAEQTVAVERARIALADAEAALQRTGRLARSKTASTVALSDAESAAQLARIELQTAEIALQRRAIRAPFAGRTGLTDVSVGEVVSTSTEIVTLDDDGKIRVAFEVPERRAGQMSRGQAVIGTSQAQPGLEISGEIVAIGSRVDPATRTLTAEAEFANDDQLLKPGMAVTVGITFETPGQLTVPSLAVQWDRRGSFVWHVADDAVRRAEVAIVSRQSGSILVKSELRPGDRVVVEGVQRLREGARVVEVGVPAAAPPQPSPPVPAAPAVSQTAPTPARS